ncbi:hypothetical protein GE21DRAFT_5034 [Neurospora crassa]|uniref:Uncharacterized protein n=1 Tax=Neurospora crassa (strain ATCC 24698 / 74-OR23-1A / CBS 708.71 / DSM 1257 / FGSC 987) TaxID=367110 RepID=Q7S3J2_NEUCR|nr:hypothetical protein NCU08251 [Neurospora crassa OR74A]EAA30105.1 hypothetical protein NCU08251 [Neurospora crassa OR74A]KHE86508.1 hypothetical protein GE21DRAFT_5034 [Neurospora crassa]|eukprot:XP_959341.1 hypothetical protein NCU08251 [Neurospora crassa OR74A]
MKSPANKAAPAQHPSSKEGTSSSNQSPESALSEDQEGNREGSQVHQQSPGQHDTSPRENVNDVVPLPINVPQHQQQSSSQHGNHSLQACTNPPVNPPSHDHHNSSFDDIHADELFDDMPSHFDHVLEHDLLIGDGSFEDNDSHVNVYASAQVQNYQQGEQNVPVVSPPAHQSMMNNHGGPHQEPPHPLSAHHLQEPAIPQLYAVPNGHAYGAQHLSVDQQIHNQVQVPVQHQFSVQHQVIIQQQTQMQHQAHIQQQALMQYLATVAYRYREYLEVEGF